MPLKKGKKYISKWNFLCLTAISKAEIRIPFHYFEINEKTGLPCERLLLAKSYSTRTNKRLEPGQYFQILSQNCESPLVKWGLRSQCYPWVYGWWFQSYCGEQKKIIRYLGNRKLLNFRTAKLARIALFTRVSYAACLIKTPFRSKSVSLIL